MATLDLQKVNFMSKATFDTIEVTDDTQIYMVGNQLLGIPDYSAMISLTAGTFTADADVLLSFAGYGTSKYWAVTINGTVICNGGNGRGDNPIGGGSQVIIPKGTVYTVTLQNCVGYKIPFIGGSNQ